MMGSKAWTVLDSLEILDHNAVLMQLAAASTSASAMQSSQLADSASVEMSSAPGLIPLNPPRPNPV